MPVYGTEVARDEVRGARKGFKSFHVTSYLIFVIAFSQERLQPRIDFYSPLEPRPSPLSSTSVFHNAFLIPLPVPFLVAGALVVALLAFGQADIEFDAAVFPVQR